MQVKENLTSEIQTSMLMLNISEMMQCVAQSVDTKNHFAREAWPAILHLSVHVGSDRVL